MNKHNNLSEVLPLDDISLTEVCAERLVQAALLWAQRAKVGYRDCSHNSMLSMYCSISRRTHKETGISLKHGIMEVKETYLINWSCEEQSHVMILYRNEMGLKLISIFVHNGRSILYN